MTTTHHAQATARRRRSACSPACSLGAAFAGLPVLWMLSSSFKSNTEIFEYPPRLITESFSFDAYATILTDPEKLRFFLNSYVVALSVTALTLLVAILAAYAFSRFEFRGKRPSTSSSSACRRCRRSRCSSRTSGSS